MGLDDFQERGRNKLSSMQKDRPNDNPAKDVFAIAEDAEVYVKNVFEAATPRELNHELSQTIYYDSDVLKISTGTMRKYLNDYLFEKFPGRTHDVHSVRTNLVKEICHIYDEYIKKGIEEPGERKIKPAEYKEWQIKQLVRAIEEVKRLTVISAKAPANVPVKPYDPFDYELPHEKVINPKILALKLQMINALFADLF